MLTHFAIADPGPDTDAKPAPEGLQSAIPDIAASTTRCLSKLLFAHLTTTFNDGLIPTLNPTSGLPQPT